MTNLNEKHESTDNIEMEWIMNSSAEWFQSYITDFLTWCDNTINEADVAANTDVLQYIKDARKSIDGMRMLKSLHEINAVRNLARVTIKGAFKVAHCLKMEGVINE